MATENQSPTAQSGPSAEETLHAAICNAVILLNNGEEFAPRVSAVLRAALAEYIPTPTPTTPPAGARDAVTDAADRIVLWSRGVQPNWWFVAERSKRPDVNGMPVYETLDPITKATQPAATGAGEGLKDGDLIVGDMAYDD